jgi:Phage integrase family.
MRSRGFCGSSGRTLIFLNPLPRGLPFEPNFQRDKALPMWHGWHAFRRGLATNLHTLGVADKDIQAILRHSNIGLTMNVYVKSVNESQVNALDALNEKFATCSNLAANQTRVIQ